MSNIVNQSKSYQSISPPHKSMRVENQIGLSHFGFVYDDSYLACGESYHFFIISIYLVCNFRLNLKFKIPIDYIKNYFKQKLFIIKFPTKNSRGRICLPPSLGVKLQSPKICHFKNIMMRSLEWESRYTLGLNDCKKY